MSSLTSEPNEIEDLIRMIDESAANVLKDDLLRARKQRFTHPGFEKSKWNEFAELGWLTLCVDEQDGGLGLGVRELCTLAHRLGQHLTPEPILACALIAGILPDTQRQDLFDCKHIILPGFATFGQSPPALDNGRITGTIACIPYALGADAFLVQLDDGAALVQRDDAGASLTAYDTHDGGHFCTLQLDGVPVQHVSCDMAMIREQATLVTGAYLSGLSEKAFQITQDYIKDRVQFDKPIGSFQVVQHRMVDLFLELKLGRAALNAATKSFADGTRDSAAQLAVSLAKARLSKASSVITREAIQLHGGIGYTDEADIGLYLRKSMTMSGTFGTESFHRNRAFTLMEANRD